MSGNGKAFISKCYNFNRDFMYITMRFEGYVEKIVDAALAKGVVKTMAEAIRLGLLELNDKYLLMPTNLSEDEQDLRDALEVDARIRAGKEKLYTLAEVKRFLRRRK